MSEFVKYAVAAALLCSVGGCDLITDPDPLEEFAWEVVQGDVSTIQEGIDATGVGGEITFLGQFKTSSTCYTLIPDFKRDGTRLTLDVTARASSTPNCAQTVGGFRYTGALRHLRSDTYTLKVNHIVPGTAQKSYAVTVRIR